MDELKFGSAMSASGWLNLEGIGLNWNSKLLGYLTIGKKSALKASQIYLSVL